MVSRKYSLTRRLSRLTLGLTVALCGAAGTCQSAEGSPAVEQLLPKGPQSNFGEAVGAGVTGRWAIVGAPGDGQALGHATLYHNNLALWKRYKTLTPGHGNAMDDFGAAVAVSNKWAVVGAPGENDGAGAIYLYALNDFHWSLAAELSAPDGAMRFGSALNLGQPRIVVGAPGSNGVYIYRIDNGVPVLQTALMDPDAGPGDDFGASVAAARGNVVVGEPGFNGRQGRAFVFTGSGSTWRATATLTQPDPAGTPEFGHSIWIQGRQVFVGAPQQDDATGAVYTFARIEKRWTNQDELTADDGQPGDSFGFSLGSANHLLVGAPTAQAAAGAVYEFVPAGAGWLQVSETVIESEEPTQLGYSVAAMRRREEGIVGAPGLEPTGGSAYVLTSSDVGQSRR